MAPSTPGSTGAPFSSRTVTAYPGTGTDGEPGLIGNVSRPRRLAAIGHPVSVCHQLSTTGITEPVGRPLPRVGVQPLPGEEQGAQGGEVVGGGLRAGGVLLLDRPVCGRRGEHRDGAVLGDHPEERPGVGGAHRLALVEDGGAAGEQRRVDDVGVADDPADVAGREPRLPRVDAVDVLHRPAQRDRVAAVVADDALRLPGRAGRVEDVERVGRGDLDAVGARRRPPVRTRSRPSRRPPASSSAGPCSRWRTTQTSGWWVDPLQRPPR